MGDQTISVSVTLWLSDIKKKTLFLKSHNSIVVHRYKPTIYINIINIYYYLPIFVRKYYFIISNNNTTTFIFNS